MTLRQVVWGTPVTTLFTLLPAYRARMGDDSMPSPSDLAACKARADVHDWYKGRYNII